MESLAMNNEFWRGKIVFVTGHTGFKGGWLSLWLTSMGAKVYGFGLAPNTENSFFESVNLGRRLSGSTIADIRDFSAVHGALSDSGASIIFHLAAQPLVRQSYQEPLETFSTNVMGTVNILESARLVKSVKAVINITTDKCYQNEEWAWPYREIDKLGGRDPYSNSKACSELVTQSYKSSFFEEAGVGVATVRAGNVIGGGDWSADRLLPDCFRAIARKTPIQVRYPEAIRPWQHVLEPLCGYILLAERLTSRPRDFSSPWNFGPSEEGAKSVSWIIENIKKSFPSMEVECSGRAEVHETTILRLDSSKSQELLGWRPRLRLEESLTWTIDWQRAWIGGTDMEDASLSQIAKYLAI